MYPVGIEISFFFHLFKLKKKTIIRCLVEMVLINFLVNSTMLMKFSRYMYITLDHQKKKIL